MSIIPKINTSVSIIIIANYRIALKFRRSKFSRIAVFEISLKYFREFQTRHTALGGTSLASAPCGSGSLHPAYCASSRLKYSNRAMVVDARTRM